MDIREKTDAVKKLQELLHCGNERVELSAAKELLALEEEKTEEKESSVFSVEIRVVDDNG